MNWQKKAGILALCTFLAVGVGALPAFALRAGAGVGVPVVVAYPDYCTGYVVPTGGRVPCSVVLTRDGYPVLPNCGGGMVYVAGTRYYMPCYAPLVPVMAPAAVPVVPVTAYYPAGVPCYPGVVVVP